MLKYGGNPHSASGVSHSIITKKTMQKNNSNKRIDLRGKKIVGVNTKQASKIVGVNTKQASKIVGVNTKQTSKIVASKTGRLLKSLGSQPRRKPFVRDLLSSLGSALSQARPKHLLH
jgi:hypothetical protein